MKYHIFFTRIILLLIISALSSASYAQKREVGFSLGAMYYTGDMARNWVIPNTGIAGMIFLRSNINDHLSLRIAYTGGNLKGNDNKPLDAFATARSSSFNLFISEFSWNFYSITNFQSSKRNQGATI